MGNSLADSLYTVVVLVTDGFDALELIFKFDFFHVVKPCVEAYFEPHLRQKWIYGILVALEPDFVKEFLLQLERFLLLYCCHC